MQNKTSEELSGCGCFVGLFILVGVFAVLAAVGVGVFVLTLRWFFGIEIFLR